MSRPVIFYIWFLSLMGALFLGRELGIMKGEHLTKAELGYKLQNCNKQIAGIEE